ncbi:MAG: hypothetical protein HYZ67_02685 [Chlamydiae bacterium]|nr:hypothetical protein [Chlamydiota bacterium]
MRLLTNDLYEGAWLLSRGMTLVNLWMEANGKRTVVFEFEGTSIEGLKEEYKHGKAQANVYQLKVAMSELRDRMYALIREKTDSPQNGLRLRKGGQYVGACQTP